MAKIFVSYSRKNIDFARKLTGVLEQQGLDFWVDWEGIPPTVDWMKEIQRGIEEADTFLFIISPDSIASKVCKDELDLASKNGKRLIPVVAHEVKWDDVPSNLSHLNYIFFREHDDFDAALDKLLTGINTDYDWVQTHRRLQVKALEWGRGSRDNGFLLRGRDLEEAERQILINATKDPVPTDLQREYLLQSRQATNRQRRITTGLLVFIILVMIGIIAALVTPRIQEAIAKNQARGEIVLIEGGMAKFGTDNPDYIANGAISLREIPFSTFEIERFEVTNKQYKLCVTYGNCTVPLEQADFNDATKQDFPVVFVTLFQANNYCRWVGLRLLTEVEWERAARGSDGSSWPWGRQVPSPDLVNMASQGTDQPTAGLQAKDSNPGGVSSEGVYNLVGNAYELTATYKYSGGDYDGTYWDGTPANFKGTALYAARGGSWVNNIDYVSRYNTITGTTAREDLGFRCGTDVK